MVLARGVNFFRPAILRSDNLSPGTHELKIMRRQDLTSRFRAVLERYGHARRTKPSIIRT
jgi:hypothetical protein